MHFSELCSFSAGQVKQSDSNSLVLEVVRGERTPAGKVASAPLRGEIDGRE